MACAPCFRLWHVLQRCPSLTTCVQAVSFCFQSSQWHPCLDPAVLDVQLVLGHGTNKCYFFGWCLGLRIKLNHGLFLCTLHVHQHVHIVTLMQLWHFGYLFCCKDQIYMSMIICSKYCLELSFFLLSSDLTCTCDKFLLCTDFVLFRRWNFRRLVASQASLEGGRIPFACETNWIPVLYWLRTVICHSTSVLLGVVDKVSLFLWCSRL
jgi:hypothetical protein